MVYGVRATALGLRFFGLRSSVFDSQLYRIRLEPGIVAPVESRIKGPDTSHQKKAAFVDESVNRWPLRPAAGPGRGEAYARSSLNLLT
jgi:hypothetical protein